MKKTKPYFWDYKKPNFLSYLLLIFTIPIIINNFFLNRKKNKKFENIKTICIGNIYVGGTAKTPLTIKISQILSKLNIKNATIKKFYKNQIDEQNLLEKKTNLYCFKKRRDSLKKAIQNNFDVALFDDGLQDRSINYDLNFVCFNTLSWIGNGMLIPAGPLREKIKSISKYDAIFLNGNGENIVDIKIIIKNYNSTIKIFETSYVVTNIAEFQLNDKYLVFSGIGNPNTFENTLKKYNLNIVEHMKFPDHYLYSNKDINKIKSRANDLDCKILTTEKDFVKLNSINSKEIQFTKVDIEIKKENELVEFIQSNL
jgi:tetraacyldisaccharide 4'-kinase